MNDDRMDEILAAGARDYNAPGPVPRDEMWARIQAARGERGAARLGGGHQRTARWVWPSFAAAAVLLLAVGIAIGRRLEHVAPAPIVANAPADTAARRDSSPSVAPPRTTAVAATTDSLVRKLHQEARTTDRRVRELAAAAPRASDQTPSLAYQLVVLQHLAGSEAMITSFRASARQGKVDAELATWSRELLSTTRMLEASPVTTDPTMKRLLEDLELVIAQIAQYTTRGTNNTDELDLIEQSIDKRGVITKLRGTLPRRLNSAGT